MREQCALCDIAHNQMWPHNKYPLNCFFNCLWGECRQQRQFLASGLHLQTSRYFLPTLKVSYHHHPLLASFKTTIAVSLIHFLLLSLNCHFDFATNGGIIIVLLLLSPCIIPFYWTWLKKKTSNRKQHLERESKYNSISLLFLLYFKSLLLAFSRMDHIFSRNNTIVK